MSEPKIPRPKIIPTTRPTRSPFYPENIPADLRECRQWVLWRYERKNKEWTKPPYQTNGHLADVSNQATWTSFDDVLRAIKTGKFDGVGFVVTAADPYTGFDFDGCYDGKINNEKVANYICELASYTEFSPSNKGLRVWVKAKLPERGGKKGNFEAYCDGKYLTVTGNLVPGVATTTKNRQDEATSVWRDIFGNERTTIKEAPKKTKSDATFDLLWRGKWKDAGYPSPSEADLALCNIFARMDPNKVDTLFRGSGLMRPKWDEKHGAQTYGQMTIEKAITGITGKEAGKMRKKLKVKTAVEMEREYRHEENWIVDDWLPEGACVLVSGSPESYKSWLTTELAVAITSGRPFFRKYAVKRPGVCLIIQKEDSWPLTMDRIRILCTEPGKVEESTRKNGIEWKFYLPQIPKRLLFEDSRLFRFDDEGTMVELENLLIKYRPILVVIDPLYATAKAKDYMMEVAGLMNRLKPLRDKYGTSFIVVHHSSKWGKGTGRAGAWGSVFLNAWGEVTWAMNEIADGKVEVQRTYKGTEKFVKLVLDFKIDEEGFRVGVSRQQGDTEIEKSIKYEQIRELYRQGDTQRQIREKLKISPRTVSEALRKPTEEDGNNDE